jgi:N-acyl-D-amino-acid deacylase
VLQRLEEASQRQAVAFDVYPYDASSTVLNPARLKSSRRIVVSWSEPHPDRAGQDLAEVAACWCCSREEAAARLSPAGAIFYKMEERDVRRIVAHPMSMIGSDGLPHDDHPHPRLWGTFPRVLGRYVRDLGLLTLPDAVRKMTSLPARVFGLADRGVLREGAFADVTIFDLERVLDTATYEAPRQRPEGIRAVIVNGALTWCDGSGTGLRNGRLLARSPLTDAECAAPHVVGRRRMPLSDCGAVRQ